MTNKFLIVIGLFFSLTSYANNFLTLDDMIIDSSDIEESFRDKGSSSFVMGRKWKNGVLPIVFDSNLSKYQRNLFASACRAWADVSIVRCVEGNPKKKHIFVQNRKAGCFASLGRGSVIFRKRLINLGIGCWTRGVIIHEIGHSLGFLHEHQRSDRNEYVEIKRENIQLINYANFFSPLVTIEYSEYDFASIMHYGPMYFSKNGSPTIVPRKKYSNRYYEMGNRSRLSEGDIISVQKRYGK